MEESTVFNKEGLGSLSFEEPSEPLPPAEEFDLKDLVKAQSVFKQVNIKVQELLLEVADLSHRQRKLEGDLSQSDDLLLRRTKELYASQNELGGARQVVQELTERLEEVRTQYAEEIESRNQKIEELSRYISEMEGERESSSRLVAALEEKKSQLSEAKIENSQWTQAVRYLERQDQIARNKVQTLEESVRQLTLDRDRFGEMVETLSKENAVLKSEMEALSEKNRELEKIGDQALTKHRALENSFQNSLIENEISEKQIDKLKVEVKALKGQVAQSREEANLAAQKLAEEKELRLRDIEDLKRQKNAEEQKRLAVFNDEMDRLKESQAVALKEQLSAHEREIRRLESVTENVRRERTVVENAYVKSQQELSLSIEARSLLEQRVQELVEQERIKTQELHLQKAKLHAQEIELEKMSVHEEDVQRLRQRSELYQSKIQESESEIQNLLNRLGEQNSEIHSLRQELSQRQAKNRQWALEVKGLKETGSSLTDALKALRQEKEALEGETERLRADLAREIREKTRKTQELSEKVDETTILLSQSQVELRKAVIQVAQLRENGEKKGAELEELRRQLLKQAGEKEQRMRELRCLEEELEVKSDKMDHYYRSIDQEKRDLRKYTLKLLREAQSLKSINPLRHYLAITSSEISRLQITLSKVPPLSAERPRLEEEYEKLVRQRDSVNLLIEQSEKESTAQIKSLVELSQSEEIVPMPPPPPL